MNKAIISGTSFDELLEKASEIHDLLAVDTAVAKPYEAIVATNQKDGKWCIRPLHKSKGEYKFLQRGSSYASLEQVLDDLNKEVQLQAKEDGASVLCYLTSDADKTFDGHYKTKWLVIEPFLPLPVSQDGSIKMNVLPLELNEDEFQAATETGIAFYQNGMIYPILAESYGTLTHYLKDRRISQGYEPAITSAVYLAESFDKFGSVNLLTKWISERMHAVTSACGKKYVPNDPIPFLKSGIEEVSKLGLVDIDGWKITTGAIELNIKLCPVFSQNYDIKVKITCGQRVGMSSMVTGYLVLNKFPLRFYQSTDRIAKKQKKSVFDGLSDVIRVFQENISHKKDQMIVFQHPEKMFSSNILRTLGQKRVNILRDLTVPASGYEIGKAYYVKDILPFLMNGMNKLTMSPEVKERLGQQIAEWLDFTVQPGKKEYEDESVEKCD